MKNKVTITSKECTGPEEEWVTIFKCPECQNEAIHQNDNYCCSCGIKIEWDETAIKCFV